MIRQGLATILIILFAGAVARTAQGDEFPSFERAAERLRSATVTVRVAQVSALRSKIGAADAEQEKSSSAASAPVPSRVLVSSGVLLAGGRVVTFVNASGDVRIRITLPNGEQAEGRPRVVDHFSGLTLLSSDAHDATGIELAETVPPIGGWVLSAAGWGIEEPVLSFGILSATDRSLPRSAFPPLLQCDLRTAVSSSGAGLVDREGRLAGIVVGSDKEGERGGWTYAIDVGHVRRLLRAELRDKVVILVRRRPVVGLVLGAGPESGEVVVQRVTPGGPAEKAGIKQGDLVHAADGVNIRSVYQAVAPLIRKQPGDTMTFLVEQEDGRRSIEVTLGGGVELPGPHFAGNLGLVDPRIEVERVAKNQFDLRDRRGGVRNLSVEPATPGRTAEQPVKLLQRALEQYGSLIERYREELQRRDREQSAARVRIDSLQAEIGELKRQLDENRKSSPVAPE
jgi:serine protease Do